MKVFKTISATREYRKTINKAAGSLGLVPTMGALHSGHLSLVRQARKENDFVAISIFVNPIQFNNPDDLKNYPRDLQKDLDMLDELLGRDDFVFCPDPEEIYPEPVEKEFDFGRLAESMEGSFRPGHFNGVGIVVERLFRITSPHRAYFGEKDFQQLAVIRKMAELEHLDIEIIGCPIIREGNGLAMSSRNELLDSGVRKKAGIIFEAISSASILARTNSVEETKNIISGSINSVPGFKVEYIEFASHLTLEPVKNWDHKEEIRCFIAVHAGNVRLIDNIEFKH